MVINKNFIVFFVAAVPDTSTISLNFTMRVKLRETNTRVMWDEMVEEYGHNDTILYYYVDSRGYLNHGLMELQTNEDIRKFCGWVYEYKLLKPTIIISHLKKYMSYRRKINWRNPQRQRV